MKNLKLTIVWMIFVIIVLMIVGQAHIYCNPFYIQLDSPDNVGVLVGVLGTAYMFKKLVEITRL
jgi:hypothetical protein